MNGAVITALNEADTIDRLVSDLVSMGLAVIVVDDGSTDDTGNRAALAGATVIRHETPKGIGVSLMEAWKMAVSFRWDKTLQIDAGGSHNAYDCKYALHSEADVCIGSRFLTDNGYIGRAWRKHASKAAAYMLNWATHQKISDWTSGYRIFSRRALIALLDGNYMTNGHTWQIEVLDYAVKRGLNIQEFAISYKAGSSTLKLKTIDDFIKVFLWTMHT